MPDLLFAVLGVLFQAPAGPPRAPHSPPQRSPQAVCATASWVEAGRDGVATPRTTTVCGADLPVRPSTPAEPEREPRR